MAGKSRPALPTHFGEYKAADLVRVLDALADPARLYILQSLAEAPDGGLNVMQITALIPLSQPTVSHHLNRLTNAGLVAREKRGVFAYYSIVPEAVANATATVDGVAKVKRPARRRAA